MFHIVAALIEDQSQVQAQLSSRTPEGMLHRLSSGLRQWRGTELFDNSGHLISVQDAIPLVSNEFAPHE